jgi:hypothetical protein
MMTLQPFVEPCPISQSEWSYTQPERPLKGGSACSNIKHVETGRPECLRRRRYFTPYTAMSNNFTGKLARRQLRETYFQIYSLLQ